MIELLCWEDNEEFELRQNRYREQIITCASSLSFTECAYKLEDLRQKEAMSCFRDGTAHIMNMHMYENLRI